MSSSHSTFDIREPISGYVTRELIGRGGFGEVWKAEVPGGLDKAIKIVHAGIDSARAERELKALQRVKDVRHPLTLSIERIEIIDGTLVIVTELADCSLKDVFKRHRSKGQTGIPRDQLLALLRDAADALDYIYEEHSLQHLDIKPENLLVVGNRLKLGDFGLLKNIYERGASLVSGLTPTYAPPELFEGRPTRQSDQYSLAIVYQHMLTGELPFDGATSAQLAREHLSGVPRLNLLPRSERPIVARALSKVPRERFESCAALIAGLSAAPPDLPEEPNDEIDDDSDVSHTQTVSVPVPISLPGAEQPAGDAASSDADLDAAEEAAVDPLLSAIELSLQPARRASDSTSRRSSVIPGTGFVSTVFLGVGGTGGLILQELRRRIGDAYGSLKEVPAIQMVLMDTDGKQLNSLMQREGDWEELDVVALPLRRPQDYKFRDSGLSKWLHRRWLYNMSRTLQTEGYRPFGRLALVDHGARALVSIRTALTTAASAESVAKTSAVTGLPFQQGHVRVVIVASISGGTGSGIVLDLAYAVRGELKSRGWSDEDVLGMLMHSTPGTPAERDKALANAYAALSELGYYSSPGRFYPGENAVKAPSFHGDNRTFGTAYFVNLGDQLDTSGWQAGSEKVAEYLFCTTVTPAKMVIDAARHADSGDFPSTPSTVSLRSLDVRRLDCSDNREIRDCIEQACRDVVSIWQSGEKSVRNAPSPTLDSTTLLDLCANPVVEEVDPIDTEARQWLVDSGLESNALQEMVRDIVEQEWGAAEHEHLHGLFEQLCDGVDQRRVPSEQLLDAAARLMDSILGNSAEQHSDQPLLCDRMREVLAARAADVGSSLAGRVRALVDDPDAGVKAARAATELMLHQLKDLQRVLQQSEQQPATEEDETSEETPVRNRSWLGVFRRQPRDEEPSLLDEMLAGSLDQLNQAKLAALQQYLNLIGVQLSSVTDQLNHLSRDLKCLAAEFPCTAPRDSVDPDSDRAGGPAAQRYARRIHDSLKRDRERIAQSINNEFLQTVLSGEEKLRRFLGVHSQLQATLLTPLRNLARKVVLSQVRETTQSLIEESARDSKLGKPTVCAQLVEEFVTERGLKPDVARDRLVVLAPESVDPQLLQNAFASCPTLIPARTNGITICCESSARPLEDVADEMIQQQDLYRQLAEKLHTREDVKWSPLALPGAESRAPSRDSVPAR